MKTKWELLDYPTGVFNCSMLFMRMRSPLITDNVHHFIQVSGILFVTLEWKIILPWVFFWWLSQYSVLTTDWMNSGYCHLKE
jgi:hypothetical protein